MFLKKCYVLFCPLNSFFGTNKICLDRNLQYHNLHTIHPSQLVYVRSKSFKEKYEKVLKNLHIKQTSL